jgi:hypothetical protein
MESRVPESASRTDLERTVKPGIESGRRAYVKLAAVIRSRLILLSTLDL